MTRPQTPTERQIMIDRLRRFPAELDALVSGLSDADLTTAYLAGEWTVAQNVHHLADSHMNAFIRLKLILHEDRPALRVYNQDDWATSPDADNTILADSLILLRGLHARWCRLLESLDAADWDRVGLHPEYGETSAADQLSRYADHCDAHIDQINRTLAAKGT